MADIQTKAIVNTEFNVDASELKEAAKHGESLEKAMNGTAKATEAVTKAEKEATDAVEKFEKAYAKVKKRNSKVQQNRIALGMKDGAPKRAEMYKGVVDKLAKKGDYEQATVGIKMMTKWLGIAEKQLANEARLRAEDAKEAAKTADKKSEAAKKASNAERLANKLTAEAEKNAKADAKGAAAEEAEAKKKAAQEAADAKKKADKEAADAEKRQIKEAEDAQKKAISDYEKAYAEAIKRNDKVQKRAQALGEEGGYPRRVEIAKGVADRYVDAGDYEKAAIALNWMNKELSYAENYLTKEEKAEAEAAEAAKKANEEKAKAVSDYEKAYAEAVKRNDKVRKRKKDLGVEDKASVRAEKARQLAEKYAKEGNYEKAAFSIELMNRALADSERHLTKNEQAAKEAAEAEKQAAKEAAEAEQKAAKEAEDAEKRKAKVRSDYEKKYLENAERYENVRKRAAALGIKDVHLSNAERDKRVAEKFTTRGDYEHATLSYNLGLEELGKAEESIADAEKAAKKAAKEAEDAEKERIKAAKERYDELVKKIKIVTKEIVKGLKTSIKYQAKFLKLLAKTGFQFTAKLFGGMAKSIAGYVKALSKASLVMGAVAIPIIAKGINNYSDLVEIINVTNGVFDENAKSVHEWAQNTAKDFGLTLTQAEKFTSTYGAMLKAGGVEESDFTVMAKNLAALTGDAASFYNLDFDEVFDKIKGGINGQARAMTGLGVSLTVATLEEYRLAQGIETAYDKMSEADKRILRYNYIMDTMSDSIGDYARTAGTWANVMRSLQNSVNEFLTVIGQYFSNVFLPILQRVNEVFGAFVNSVKAWTGFDISVETDKAGTYVEGLEDEADAIDDVSEAAESASDNLQGFDELNNLSADASSSASDSLGDLSSSLTPDDIYGNDAKLKKTTKGIKEYWEAFWGADFVSYGKKVSTLIDNFSDKILDFWDKLSSLGIGQKVAEFFNGLMDKDWGKVGKLITSPIRLLIEEFNKFSSKFNFSKFGDKLKETLLGALGNLWGSSDSLDKPGQLAGENIANFINGLSDVITHTLGDGEVVDTFTEGFSNMLSTAITNLDEDKLGEALSDIMRNLGNLMRNLTTSKDMKKLGTKLGEALNEGIEDGSAGDLLGGFLDLVLDIIDGVAAFIETVDWFELAGSLLTALRDAIKDHPDAANLIGTALKAILAWELLKTIVSSAITTLGEKIIGKIAAAFATKVSTDALATGLSGALGTVKTGLKAGTALFTAADAFGLVLGGVISAAIVAAVAIGINEVKKAWEETERQIAETDATVKYAKNIFDNKVSDAGITEGLSNTWDQQKAIEAAKTIQKIIDLFNSSAEDADWSTKAATGYTISYSEYQHVMQMYDEYIPKLAELLGDSATAGIRAKYAELRDYLDEGYWKFDFHNAKLKYFELIAENDVLLNSLASAEQTVKERERIAREEQAMREQAMRDYAISAGVMPGSRNSNEYMLNIGLTMGTTAQSQAYTNASNLRLKMFGAN